MSARLVCDAAAIAPGSPFWVGVRFDIAEEWHINWRNPGDAGLAPGIAWTLPDGFSHEPLRWPHPNRYEVGPLVLFGYESEVALLARIIPAEDLRPGETVTLGAGVSWLACAEACVPGEADLALTLPVAERPRSDTESLAFLDRMRARLPDVTGPWTVDAWYEDDYTFFLDIQSADAETPALEDAYFFPFETGLIENGEPQVLSLLSANSGGGGYRLAIERSCIAPVTPERLAGVVVWEARGRPQAFHVDVPLSQR